MKKTLLIMGLIVALALAACTPATSDSGTAVGTSGAGGLGTAVGTTGTGGLGTAVGTSTGKGTAVGTAAGNGTAVGTAAGNGTAVGTAVGTAAGNGTAVGTAKATTAATAAATKAATTAATKAATTAATKAATGQATTAATSAGNATAVGTAGATANATSQTGTQNQPSILLSSELIGSEVVDTSGQTVGSIMDLLVQQNGTINYVLLDAADFLNSGGTGTGGTGGTGGAQATAGTPSVQTTPQATTRATTAATSAATGQATTAATQRATTAATTAATGQATTAATARATTAATTAATARATGQATTAATAKATSQTSDQGLVAVPFDQFKVNTTGDDDKQILVYQGTVATLRSMDTVDAAMMNDDNFLLKGTGTSAQFNGLVRASQLNNFNLQNNDKANLGDVRDLVVDVKQGMVTYGVVDFGGFLGIGEQTTAVPWTKFTINESGTNPNFMLDVNADTLRNAPTIDLNAWPSWQQRTPNNTEWNTDWEVNTRSFWQTAS